MTNPIVKHWQRLSKLPGGGWLFSFLLGWKTPYSGSIRAQVEAIKPGYARVRLKDRRGVRNHLNSIHAIALVNLGEIATGLAVLSAIADNMRGIVISINAEYIKKARGNLVASATFEMPQTLEDNTSYVVVAELKDLSGEVVTRVAATWLIGFKAHR